MSASPDVKCVGVSTTFIHGESGRWWTESCFCHRRIDPQGFGSAITYWTRYLVVAMAGVATDDDDGNEVTNPQQTQQVQRQPQPQAVERKKQ